ncbi:Palmitoyltransferase zdhhc13 [Dinochytrium kinnereticum]|nr:Palmitoyltransferase zdhhc13 [Dinochytrium kinnereticum]
MDMQTEEYETFLRGATVPATRPHAYAHCTDAKIHSHCGRKCGDHHHHMDHDDGPPMLENSQDLDIFEASQKGLLPRVKQLIDVGNVSASARDNENCTALHWAALNNHVVIARLLIERGAEVDAVGGDLMGTALQWASRSGHVQMATFLCQRGANPLLKDNQGYNSLHIAAQAGQAMMILYFDAMGVSLDSLDSMKRSALMWTAYKGNSFESMDALIKRKADLDLTDPAGYTALYWAIISNHLNFAKKLIQAGASIDVKDSEGKSPFDCAKERGYANGFAAIVQECRKGEPSGKVFTKDTTHRIIYIVPYIGLPLAIWVFSNLEWFIAIPAFVAIFYLIISQFIVAYLMGGDSGSLSATPLLTSIPQASIVYCALAWLWVLPFYSFYRALSTDPGYLSKMQNEDERKKNVLQLAEEDFRVVVPSETVPSPYCFLGSSLCTDFVYDPALMTFSVWILFNSIWVIFLFLCQSYQISTNLTTNEFSNFHRFDYLINPQDKYLPPHRRRVLNPFDLGPIANFADFLFGGRILKDVYWFNIYEVPRAFEKFSQEIV